jgi:Protein of unknown function (DUF3175)
MPVARRPSSKLVARTSRCGHYWSDAVTHGSDALDLEAKIFTLGSPRDIAASLRHSAERSRRRKASPYQSAMSMLTFYLNRARKGLPERQRAVLDRAKQELRKAFGRV